MDDNEDKIAIIRPGISENSESSWEQFAKASNCQLPNNNCVENAPPRCQACAAVTENLSGCVESIHRNSINYPEVVEGKRVYCGIQWDVQLGKLVEATSFRCQFCSFVLDNFFCQVDFGNGGGFVLDAMWLYSPERSWYGDLENTESCEQAIERGSKIAEVLEDDMLGFWVVPHHTRLAGIGPSNFTKLEIRLLKPNVSSKNMMFFHKSQVEVDVFAVRGNPAEKHVKTQPPNGSPNSEKGLKQAAAWLDECSHLHGTLCSHDQSYLPTRVLDVSGGDSIRLHISQEKSSGRYTALSYCWGGPQEFQTTQSTLNQMTDGFSIHDLPRTLRDAVTVTQNLGIKYLWIDSLCIIQDSPEDKSCEIGKMADIYKYADLTICAANARQANEGFLYDTSDPETGLWKGMIPLSYPVYSKDKSELSSDDDPRLFDVGTIWLTEDTEMYPMFGDPISERAWTLQERLLSPRLLYYGRWPMWRCQGAVHTDGGSLSQSSAILQAQERPLLQSFRNSAVSGAVSNLKVDFFTLRQLYETWYATIENYSGRDIGTFSDRLPAVGGISSEFHRITGAEYVAGLWKENFIHDLMWITESQLQDWKLRPKSSVPSWSWASVEAKVAYHNITIDSKQEAIMLECDVTPTNHGMVFGEVAKGWAVISGLFAKINREDALILLQDSKMGPSQSKNISMDPKAGSQWIQEILKGALQSKGRTQRGQKGGEIKLGSDTLPFQTIQYQMESAHSSTTATERRPYQPLSAPKFPKMLQEYMISTENPEDLSVEFPGNVYALITFSRDWKIDTFNKDKKLKETCYSGLLLEEISEGCYKRVGAFVNESRDWMDQSISPWQRMDITLV